MIHVLIQTTIKNPITIHLNTLTIYTTKLLIKLSIPQKIFPIFTINHIQITTFLPKTSPINIKQLITIPIKKTLTKTNKIKHISSINHKNLYKITLKIKQNTKTSKFLNKIHNQIQSNNLKLPNKYKTPNIQKLHTKFPTITITIHKKINKNILQNTTQNLQTKLHKFPNIKQINIYNTHNPHL